MPFLVTMVATVELRPSNLTNVTIAPALACTGLTAIPAIPNNGEDGKPPLVGSSSRVLLYEASSLLTKKPELDDDLVLVEGGQSDAGTFPGVHVPFQRRELFPSLVELVPIAPLKPGTEYTLLWNEKGFAQPRAQAHFFVSDRRDDKSPKIETIGPATVEPPPEARTSCDTGLRKLAVPFAYEDESPIVVGVWEGAGTPQGQPLGYSAVTNKRVTVMLRDGSTPSVITLVAFDSAGHRSAPCSISVDGDPLQTSTGRGCGCGKSSTPKREVKNCQARASAGK